LTNAKLHTSFEVPLLCVTCATHESSSLYSFQGSIEVVHSLKTEQCRLMRDFFEPPALAAARVVAHRLMYRSTLRQLAPSDPSAILRSR
jgi:hypothetical protein